jgi:hypothetical protein
MRAHLIVTRFVPRKLIAVFATALVALAVACTSATATPEPSPTPIVEPTPTAVPTAMPTPNSGSTDLQRIEADAIATLEDMLAELGSRESATDQEATAAEYLKTNLQEMGYSVEIQTFSVENLSLSGMGLTLGTPGSPEVQEFRALPMVESGL